jgi:hypothetical protein
MGGYDIDRKPYGKTGDTRSPVADYLRQNGYTAYGVNNLMQQLFGTKSPAYPGGPSSPYSGEQYLAQVSPNAPYIGVDKDGRPVHAGPGSGGRASPLPQGFTFHPDVPIVGAERGMTGREVNAFRAAKYGSQAWAPFGGTEPQKAENTAQKAIDDYRGKDW